MGKNGVKAKSARNRSHSKKAAAKEASIDGSRFQRVKNCQSRATRYCSGCPPRCMIFASHS